MKESLAFVFLLIAVHAYSQSNPVNLYAIPDLQDFYRTSAGIRVGWPIAAVTVKHFFMKRKAVEVMAAPRFGGGSLTVLFEKHVPARKPSIYWYYGAGVNAGVFKGDIYSNYSRKRYEEKHVVSVGFNVVLGIEMIFLKSPYSISFDLKPRVAIYNPGGSALEGAVTFKYIWGW
jgi:hypothetical protein